MRDRLIVFLREAHREWLRKEYDKETTKNIDEYVADELIKNGVLVPPCDYFDTVFCIVGVPNGNNVIRKCIVDEINFVSKRGVRPWAIRCRNGKWFDNCDIGKTVFLTREEAEKALKEREGNG